MVQSVTMKKKLVESGAFVAEKSDKGRLVRIIREGQGSSGFYTKELLKEYASVFSDTLSFVNHPINPDKPWERSFLDIAGTIEGETFYEEHEGVGGIYGYFRENPKYTDDLNFVAEKIGLSIYIEGDGATDPDKGVIVESLNGSDPYRSVDLVIAAGAGGRFEKLEEAFRVREGLEESQTRPGAAERKDENTMDVEAKLTELTATVEALVEQLKAEKAVQVEAQDAEKAVATAVEQYDASVAAIEAADLLPSQATALRAEAKTGKDITADIESAKIIASEARAAVAPREDEGPTGRVHESAATTEDDFTISGWGK